MTGIKSIHKFIIFSLALFSFGCASQHGFNESASEFSALADTDTTQDTEVSERQVIRTAQMALEVEQPKQSSSAIIALVKAEGGYLENSYNYANENLSLKIRIPSQKLDSLLERVSKEGLVTSQSINSRDVTEQMLDIDARLKNLIELRDRMRKLLNKAQKVSEILEIEKELSRLQTLIDRIEGQRKLLKNKISYSSLDLDLDKKITYGPITLLVKGVVTGISKLFIWKK